MFFITVKKSTIKKIIVLIVGIIILALVVLKISDTRNSTVSIDTIDTIDSIDVDAHLTVFSLLNRRNNAILAKDADAIAQIYDRNIKYSLWAYEHEVKKMKYLHMWSEKQGVTFKEIKSQVIIRSVKERQTGGISVNFVTSTEYIYSYNDTPDVEDMFRIGTYHVMSIDNRDENWIIVKEWYTDPFADSLHLDEIKSASIKEHIISQQARDFSDLNERRVKAVEYADQYCGAAADEEFGYKYNNAYRNYNPLGGDCANFASQILHEGGGFRKNSTWNYDRGGATKAWVNAGSFTNYMLYSGRASLIAKGSYDQVIKSSYKLLPGDFVAYEKRNGDIVHVSVVTGADSKGYSLVNCHNTDRYRVPWDLGWSNKGIKFWLVRVHY